MYSILCLDLCSYIANFINLFVFIFQGVEFWSNKCNGPIWNRHWTWTRQKGRFVFSFIILELNFFHLSALFLFWENWRSSGFLPPSFIYFIWRSFIHCMSWEAYCFVLVLTKWLIMESSFVFIEMVIWFFRISNSEGG